MVGRQIIFFSLIAIAIGIFLWRRGNKILSKGKRSIATIISNTYRPDNDGEGGGAYYPTIKFITEKNESVTKESSIGTLPARSVGTTINVVYNPDNPHDFVSYPGIQLEILPRILVAVGLTGMIVAALTMFDIISIIPE